MSEDDFLSRWSRRKAEAKAGTPSPEPATPPEAVDPSTNREAPAPVATPETLPPVESLTPESDFTPFMKPGVEPGVRQQALKTLFRSPNFNVMDGLDVYIDDYSKPDPLPDSWLSMMNQVERLGDFAKKVLEEAPEDEKAAPDSGERAGEVAVEKSQQDQLVESPPSSDSLNTANAAIPAPPVQE